jgi:tetratricopeptide (TPR) repeat protein
VRFQIADAGGASTRTFYVVREDVGYRILGARAVDLAEEAVRRADRGEVAGARRLLDWAREEAGAGAGDPFDGDPLPLFWTLGQQAEADAVRAAAASVMVNDGELAAEGLAILAGRRARAQDPAERLRLDAARLTGYATLERHADVLALVEQLAPSHASSEALFARRVVALIELRRWDELKRLAEERLRAVPGHASATRALLSALRHQGAFAEVERRCAAFLDSGRASAADFNNCGWNGLFVEGPREAALARVRRAVEMSSRRNTAFLHTLAALHADVGQYAEAREIILEAINTRESVEEPQPDDWYVIGRIAEGYGLGEAARAAYARVRQSPDADATWVLARQRIKALETGLSSVAKSGRGRGH